MIAVLRRLERLEPLRADALLAVVLAIVFGALTPVIPYHRGGYRHADALAVILAVLAALPLTLRRRAPLAAWGLSLAPMLVFLARGYQGGPALLSPLVAVYTVATLLGHWRARGVALATAVLMITSREAFSPESVGTLAVDAIGFIGAALFLGWAVASRRAYVAAVAERAVSAERVRIARELHDAVAHSIATINVQAGVAAHVAASRPDQAAETLASIRDTSKQALAELREILGLLRQTEEEQPRAPTAGLDQLQGLLETCRRGGVQVELAVRGTRPPLPAAVDVAAYRILQESLTNVIRHAPGATARVTIDYGEDALGLSVTDDGAGASAFLDGSGQGIQGMRERAAALEGELEAGPLPDGGFAVTASLPLRAGVPT